MPKRIVLAVGTRKGCFLLESDEGRRDWEVRGPFCDGWPVYHAVDEASGTIYASAASEWHGAGVWRSSDMGETWELSSEGLAATPTASSSSRRSQASRSATASPGRGRGGRSVRERRRRRDVVAREHARRPAGARLLERPVAINLPGTSA